MGRPGGSGPVRAGRPPVLVQAASKLPSLRLSPRRPEAPSTCGSGTELSDAAQGAELKPRLWDTLTRDELLVTI